MSLLRKFADLFESNPSETIPPQGFHQTGPLEEILTPSPLGLTDGEEGLDLLGGGDGGDPLEISVDPMAEDLTGESSESIDSEIFSADDAPDSELDEDLDSNDSSLRESDEEELGDPIKIVDHLDDSDSEEELGGEAVDVAETDDTEASEVTSLNDADGVGEDDSEPIDEEASEAAAIITDTTSKTTEDSEVEPEPKPESVDDSDEVSESTVATDADTELDPEPDSTEGSESKPGTFVAVAGDGFGDDAGEEGADVTDTIDDASDSDTDLGSDADTDTETDIEDEDESELIDELLETLGFTFDLSAINNGLFTVGAEGQVGVDFLLDGGDYKGQLAFFSLDGLDGQEFESFDAFVAEAVDRASSNSERGHLVIDDKVEGAKFASAENSGDYRGVKLFAMKAGDTFGVMLVPNSTLSAAADGSSMDAKVRPLFSLSSLNPDDEFHFAQIADVTGDGSTFVLEDMSTETETDRDYNDVVFRVRGATGDAATLDGLIDPGNDWRDTDIGEALLAYVDPYFTPAEDLEIFDEDLSEEGYEVTSELEEFTLDNFEEPLETDDLDGEDDSVVISEEEIEVIVDDLEAKLLSRIDNLGDEADVWDSDLTALEAEFEAELNRLEINPEVTSDVYEGAEAELDRQLEKLETEIQELVNQEQVNNDLTDTERDELYTALIAEASSELDLPEANQPTIGILDTGFNLEAADVSPDSVALGSDLVDDDGDPLLAEGEGDDHGTKVLQTIVANNDNAPFWLGRSVGSGEWAKSLIEFVDTAQESGQPNALVNLSFDLTETTADGQVVTRAQLTPGEWAALEYARDNNVLVVAAAGNKGGQMSALGQAARYFDNVLTVGAVEDWTRADYSSYGEGLGLLAPGSDGDISGTSLATAQVTGVASQVWAANPDLSYRQVIELLKRTATDLDAPNWDAETGAGLLNSTAAVSFASLISWPDVAKSLPDSQGLTADSANATERPVFLRRVLKGISNASNRVRRTISRGFSSVRRSLPRYVNKVQKTFRTNINRVKQRVTTNFNRTRQSVKQTLRKWVSNTVSRVRKTVRQNATRYPRQIRNWVTNSVTRVRNSFTNNLNRIRNQFVPTVISRVRRGFSNTVRNVRTRVTNGIKRIWTPIKKRIDNIRTRVVKATPNWLKTILTRNQIGRKSRSPKIFQAAYNKINGTSQGLKPQGDAYRWGNGWTQKFRDKNGSEMLLMLEDGASEAFWIWHGNLGEYKQMGGATGHLGYPRSNEISLRNKPSGYIYQVFATENGKSRIHYSPKTGSVATWGQIGRRYTDMVGAYSWLGMPTRREYAYGSDTVFSDFEGGKIAHQRSTGRVEVLRPGQNPSWLNTPSVAEILKRFPGIHFSTVQSVQTNKALDAGGSDNSVYPHPSLNPANNYHQWGFYKIGDDYMIINKANGKALDAGGSNGEKPYGYPNPKPTNNPYQLWKVTRNGVGYQLVNKATGRALDAGGANGDSVYMYPRPISGNGYHQWKLNLPGASPTQVGYVNSSIGLRFRRDPSTNQTEITTLNNGTKLTILEKVTGQAYYPGNRTDWYKVQVGNQVGYVAAYYVSTSPNTGGDGSSGWQNPLDPGTYTIFASSRYRTPQRPTHNGIDLSTWNSNPYVRVKAAKPGKVVEVGNHPNGWGRFVRIQHDNGLRTVYAHLSQIDVQNGQQVSGGQKIGNVGSTGNSTGPHLHFEVHVSPYRHPIDTRNPENYLSF